MNHAFIRIQNEEQKKLLIQLAKTIKVDIKFISEEDLEDMLLLKAMEKTRTNKRVPKEKIMKALKK